MNTQGRRAFCGLSLQRRRRTHCPRTLDGPRRSPPRQGIRRPAGALLRQVIPQKIRMIPLGIILFSCKRVLYVYKTQKPEILQEFKGLASNTIHVKPNLKWFQRVLKKDICEENYLVSTLAGTGIYAECLRRNEHRKIVRWRFSSLGWIRR